MSHVAGEVKVARMEKQFLLVACMIYLTMVMTRNLIVVAAVIVLLFYFSDGDNDGRGGHALLTFDWLVDNEAMAFPTESASVCDQG